MSRIGWVVPVVFLAASLPVAPAARGQSTSITLRTNDQTGTPQPRLVVTTSTAGAHAQIAIQNGILRLSSTAEGLGDGAGDIRYDSASGEVRYRDASAWRTVSTRTAGNMTPGGVIYASTATNQACTAAGTSSSGVLVSGGAGAPTWGNAISGNLSPQWSVTSSTATAGGSALFGSATGAASVYGVLGRSSSTSADAAGVRGEATGASGATQGVYGASASSAGYGVYGTNTATSGTKYGVAGVVTTAGTENRAVYGQASGAATNWAGYFAGNGAVTGSLAVGTSTVGTRLDVEANFDDVVKIRRDNTAGATHIAKLLFANRYGGGENVLARIGIADGLANRGLLIFETKTNTNFPDSTTTEKMRLDWVGNLGIGTTSPQARVHCYGQGVFQNDGAVFAPPGSEPLSTGGSGSGLSMNDRDGASARWVIYPNSNVLRFYQGTDKVVITSAGNVGIGTTAPSSWGRLHVAGHKMVFDDTADHGIMWVTPATNALRAHIFRWSSDQRLYVTNNGPANLTGVYLASGATSWTSTSDRRVKRDIRETRYGLETVLRLPVHEFRYEGSEANRIGFIAQELAPIVPEIVERGDEGEFGPASSLWGVDYAGLTPVLVKAVQELHGKVEEVRRQALEIETLRNELEALKAAIARSQ